MDRGIKISLRVNIGYGNINGIEDLIGDFKRRGFIGKENLFYYFKANNDDINPKNNIKEQDIIDELQKIGFTLQEAAQHHALYQKQLEDLLKLFKKEKFFMPSPIFCGSESGMLIIDLFGKIFSCWDLVGIDDKTIGLEVRLTKKARYVDYVILLDKKNIPKKYTFARQILHR